MPERRQQARTWLHHPLNERYHDPMSMKYISSALKAEEIQTQNEDQAVDSYWQIGIHIQSQKSLLDHEVQL